MKKRIDQIYETRLLNALNNFLEIISMDDIMDKSYTEKLMLYKSALWKEYNIEFSWVDDHVTGREYYLDFSTDEDEVAFLLRHG